MSPYFGRKREQSASGNPTLQNRPSFYLFLCLLPAPRSIWRSGVLYYGFIRYYRTGRAISISANCNACKILCWLAVPAAGRPVATPSIVAVLIASAHLWFESELEVYPPSVWRSLFGALTYSKYLSQSSYYSFHCSIESHVVYNFQRIFISAGLLFF